MGLEITLIIKMKLMNAFIFLTNIILGFQYIHLYLFVLPNSINSVVINEPSALPFIFEVGAVYLKWLSVTVNRRLYRPM